MIVSNLKTDFHLYENMAIWEIENLESFLNAHGLLKEIFVREYRMLFERRFNAENSFTDSDIIVVGKLLNHFADKYFVVFENSDPNYFLLKEFQEKAILDFGRDMNVLDQTKIYVLEMDKKKDL
ncbi:MAG: hypothetical protein NTX97_14885 [Bacteroidetes bacterium]|nr:hypothetical protein [Bacteroidota bacterium]